MFVQEATQDDFSNGTLSTSTSTEGSLHPHRVASTLAIHASRGALQGQ